MRRFLRLYRIEQKLFFRSADVFIFNLCMPVAALVMIASLCKTVKSMNVATSLVYFPMLFLSGAIIPYELLPKALQHVADVLPLGQGIQLMKTVSMGVTNPGTGLKIGLLLGIAVICSLISVKTFQWE